MWPKQRGYARARRLCRLRAGGTLAECGGVWFFGYLEGSVTSRLQRQPLGGSPMLDELVPQSAQPQGDSI